MFSSQALLVLVEPLYTQLGWSAMQVSALKRLIQMPLTLSVVVGLLSDSYPIRGVRRKWYVVLGSILYAVAVFALAGISALHPRALPRHDALVVVALCLVSVASFGAMITSLCVQTRVIEYSQRESLRDRGTLQVSYLVFRRVVSLVTSVLSFLALGTDAAPTLSMSSCMTLVGVVSLAPVPLVLVYWHEDARDTRVAAPLTRQCHVLWKLMQQKAVWHVLACLACFSLFLTLEFRDATRVVRDWAGATSDPPVLVHASHDVVRIGLLLVWRAVFLNRLWPLVFAVAPACQIVPSLVGSLLVTFDVVRNRYVYRVLDALTYVAKGLQLLLPLVPVTEIVPAGSEGAIVGLTLTLQQCLDLFVETQAAQGVFRGAYDASKQEDDGGETWGTETATTRARWDLVLALLLNYALNALAAVGLWFLPSQKWDAQHVRMYGGFTAGASGALVALCLLLLLYALVVAVLTLEPATACLAVVGGSGC
ncbi:hypothetical protein PsorP6_009775 [Peronosclerospora sorghi]|uniref:Uncharacterized protein n=1 Tax=Peronosclerospora sorghi TaxID=230839 RepID=A0ACC0W114_9STRA|nr:hypothetical protein PsorP6_009775 [Peronosclerospora sorghi]